MESLSFTLAMILGLIPHLISSILSFIFFLFGISLWLFAEDAEFFALIFILIYIGAIAVLFIFVTMLLHFFEHLEATPPREYTTTGSYTEPAAFGQADAFSFSVVSEFSILTTDFLDDEFDIFDGCLSPLEAVDTFDVVYHTSHIYLLSSVLFTIFFPPFIVASFILLITTVGIFFILFQAV